jgi:hypothetical protein
VLKNIFQNIFNKLHQIQNTKYFLNEFKRKLFFFTGMADIALSPRKSAVLQQITPVPYPEPEIREVVLFFCHAAIVVVSWQYLDIEITITFRKLRKLLLVNDVICLVRRRFSVEMLR